MKVHPLENVSVELFEFESALRTIADGYSAHDCELIDQAHVGEMLSHLCDWLNEITERLVYESENAND